ncbi:hypothetical protein pb186bvf_009984 [Paramecium bursaria]
MELFGAFYIRINNKQESINFPINLQQNQQFYQQFDLQLKIVILLALGIRFIVNPYYNIQIMNNYQCAVLSSYNFLIDDTIKTLGSIFKKEKNVIILNPVKSQDINFDQQTTIRNQLNELDQKSYNTIIIIVKFDRTDLMRREIQAYKLPLQKYLRNLVILVNGFKNSQDNINDLQQVKNLFRELNLNGIVTSEKLYNNEFRKDIIINGFGKYDQNYFDYQLNQGIRIRRDEYSDSQISDQNQQQNRDNDRNQYDPSSCCFIVLLVCVCNIFRQVIK